MSRGTKQIVTALASGLLFGAGLAVGGMTTPAKVIGFLDVGGRWDPSLAFVMLGAVVIHFFAYRWVRGSAAPLFADEFAIPKLRHIDAKLVGGSALFGVGWGMGGYCPGPGIVSLGAGRSDALVFVASMALGWFLTARYDAWRAAPRAAMPASSSGGVEARS
jgi:uncharacterized membrane protein YedE/YeeE